MRTAAFRTSPELEEKIAKLFAFYGVHGDGFSEQMRLFIDELYEKLIRYKDSQRASEQSSEQKPANEEITCKLRITLKESPSGYACVNCPPRTVKLLSLEICKVCKALFLNLPTKTKRLAEEIESAQNTPEPQTPPPEKAADNQEWRKDPTKKLDKYGMNFCNNGGLWVFPSKCDDCKKRAYATYDTCQKQRIQRLQASTPSKT